MSSALTTTYDATEEIEWPEDEFGPPDDAKDIIIQLLQQNPLDRLGLGGAHEVKDHEFFLGVDWHGLLRQKAEFVPELDNEEDTSYFDSECGLCSSSCFSFVRVRPVSSSLSVIL